MVDSPFELKVFLQKSMGRHSSFTTVGSVVKHQIVLIERSGFLQKLLPIPSMPFEGKLVEVIVWVWGLWTFHSWQSLPEIVCC